MKIRHGLLFKSAGCKFLRQGLSNNENKEQKFDDVLKRCGDHGCFCILYYPTNLMWLKAELFSDKAMF